MAHPHHTPSLALLEEALTVLFCRIDDAYYQINPRGARYASLKELSDSEILTLALFQQLNRDGMTIVNIVADTIANGETALVVCQKQVALEVVQKRLAAFGAVSKPLTRPPLADPLSPRGRGRWIGRN